MFTHILLVLLNPTILHQALKIGFISFDQRDESDFQSFTILDINDNVKYLGIAIESRINFEEHTNIFRCIKG